MVSIKILGRQCSSSARVRRVVGVRGWSMALISRAVSSTISLADLAVVSWPYESGGPAQYARCGHATRRATACARGCTGWTGDERGRCDGCNTRDEQRHRCVSGVVATADIPADQHAPSGFAAFWRCRPRTSCRRNSSHQRTFPCRRPWLISSFVMRGVAGRLKKSRETMFWGISDCGTRV